MRPKLSPLLAALAVIVVAALTGSGFAVIVSDDDPATPDVTVAVPGEVAKPPPPPPAGELEPDPANADVLKDPTPEGVPKDTLQDAKGKAEDLEPKLQPKPLGGAQNYTCRRDYSGRVYSSRYGRRVISVKLHYTVSANRPGWSDVLAIQSYFKRTRIASSSRIVDFEGNCLEMVPASGAPWTQGAFNRTSWSYEIIATGTETRAQWLASPLIRKRILAAMVADDTRRFGLAARRVDPIGCVDRIGVTDHDALECGNVHTDVRPAFPWDVFMAQVRDHLSSGGRGVLYRPERKSTRRYCFHRARYRATKAADQLAYARRWKATIGRQRTQLRRLGLSGKGNRAARHRLLGAYATGRACR